MSKKPTKAAPKKPVVNNKNPKSVIKSKSDLLVHSSSKHSDSCGTQHRDTTQMDTCLHNVKHEKLTDYNSKHVYLDKENDLIEISSFAQQPYMNQNGSGGGGGMFNLNKKVKIEPSQVNSAYPTSIVNQKNVRSFKEENSSFPSSLASSTISVSSTSSLSSPNSNNLLFSSNPLVTIPVASDNLNVNISQPDQQHMFVNLTNDLLEDFHSTSSSRPFTNKQIKQESSQNAGQYFYSAESTELVTNSSVQLEGGSADVDESMFNQLEQVLSIQSNTSHLNEFECLSEVMLGGGEDQQIKSTAEQLSRFPLAFIDANSNGIKKEEGVEPLNEHSHKSFLNDSNGNMLLKDDEIAKKKRIEAISKHLKTDLIESFKSSHFLTKSKNCTTGFGDYSSQNDCRSYNYTYESRLSNHELKDNLLNESFAVIQSPVSSSSPIKVKSLLSMDETYVPNLTIDSGNYSSSMFLSSPTLDNNKPPNSVKTNSMYANTSNELGHDLNDDFTNQILGQQVYASTAAPASLKSDQSPNNLKKKTAGTPATKWRLHHQ